MSTTRPDNDQSRWERPGYGRITGLALSGGVLNVSFADGDTVSLNPDRLAPAGLHGALDWSAASINGPEIVVPGARPHAVSWLDVRALTDSAFAAHLARVADEEARHVGQQLRRLRERRGLSSTELAARADITPQSLSRIELGRHDVVYSTLQRLLAAMNYSLRDLANEPAETITVADIRKRLRSVALPKELLNRLVRKDERPGLILDRLHRIFGWSPADIRGTSALPIRASVALAAAFKSTLRQRPESGPYVLYAHYLALLAHQATPRPKKVAIERDPAAIRAEIAADHNVIDFEAILDWTWEHGIVVVPLFDPGQFHGACWLIDGRPVIVLKQNTSFDARLAFDLAHEIGHVALHLSAKDPSVIEDQEISLGGEGSEEEASDFATTLILGDAEALTAEAVAQAKGKVERLQVVVQRLAPARHVAVGSLANYIAWRLQPQGIEWWGAAANIQRSSQKPAAAAARALLDKIDWSQLDDDDARLLREALGGNGG